MKIKRFCCGKSDDNFIRLEVYSISEFLDLKQLFAFVSCAQRLFQWGALSSLIDRGFVDIGQATKETRASHNAKSLDGSDLFQAWRDNGSFVEMECQSFLGW